MATEITKTYSIQVKFSYHDGSDIADTDLHVVELRDLIKKKIKEMTAFQMGNLDSNPTQDTQEA